MEYIIIGEVWSCQMVQLRVVKEYQDIYLGKERVQIRVFGIDSNNMDKIIEILKKVIIWADNYNDNEEELDVLDIIDKVVDIEKTDDKSIILIRNFLDLYCDAIMHKFNDIDSNYTIAQANQDIKEILKILETNKSMEISKELCKRLEYLNEWNYSYFSSPMANVGLGILDATGITTKTYNYLGDIIDKQVGYSVGNSVYNVFKQPKLIK